MAFSAKDLQVIKSKEYEILSSSSALYKELMKYLIEQGRSSYLKNGFIRAALPYFYDYCKLHNIK